MLQARRRCLESFKREAVDLVLTGAPLRHVADTLGIAESQLRKCKRQYEQQGEDAFLGAANLVILVTSGQMINVPAS